jgi:hypothetical protein
MKVQLIGSVFERRGRDGDFTWMIEQPTTLMRCSCSMTMRSSSARTDRTRAIRGDVRAEVGTPRSAHTSAPNRSAPQASRRESIVPGTRS